MTKQELLFQMRFTISCASTHKVAYLFLEFDPENKERVVNFWTVDPEAMHETEDGYIQKWEGMPDIHLPKDRILKIEID